MKDVCNNIFPGNMIDASVFNSLKMLKMIEKSVLPQLPNVANQIIPQVGTKSFYNWMDLVMTRPNTDVKLKAIRRVHVITRHIIY
jgi:hypothetical protein